MPETGAFALGLICGGIVAFATGFLSAAGSSAWSWFAPRLTTRNPAPRLALPGFRPSDAPEASIAWVPRDQIRRHLADGFTLYRYPDTGEPVYQLDLSNRMLGSRYLMVRPPLPANPIAQQSMEVPAG